MIELTELRREQAKTLAVMFCAGVFTETLWQVKKLLQVRCRRRVLRGAEEAVFWAAAAAALSAFLYYCSFGKISFHAAAGFLAGLLLWKKICCGIINSPGKKQ